MTGDVTNRRFARQHNVADAWTEGLLRMVEAAEIGSHSFVGRACVVQTPTLLHQGNILRRGDADVERIGICHNRTAITLSSVPAQSSTDSQFDRRAGRAIRPVQVQWF